MESHTSSKAELKDIDLSPIIKYVNEYHEGNLLSISNWLDRAIYMFHYLPEDEFTKFDRQNTCHILMQLKEALMQAHYKQHGWPYTQLG